MTFSLSILHINFFQINSLLKNKADDKCRLKFCAESVNEVQEASWWSLAPDPFRDNMLDLSKTIFVTSLSSSAFTKTVVKIYCPFYDVMTLKANPECPDRMYIRVRFCVPSTFACASSTHLT